MSNIGPPRFAFTSCTRLSKCRGCNVEYEFLPSRDDFYMVKDEFICNSCLDKISCFQCGIGSEDVMLCDECGIIGAHSKCLGFATIPELW